jgi:hypothetical protein
MMSASLISLEERLQAYPQVKKRMEAVLAIVEGGSSERATADEAEGQVIDELRHLGHELLEAWAVTQEGRQVEAFRTHHVAVGHGKKNCIGTPPLEKSR